MSTGENFFLGAEWLSFDDLDIRSNQIHCIRMLFIINKCRLWKKKKKYKSRMKKKGAVAKFCSCGPFVLPIQILSIK